MDLDKEIVNQEESNNTEETIEKNSSEEAAKVAVEIANEIEENSKEEEQDSKEKEIAALNDRLLRNMAEFENFRKRSEKEKQGMFDMGAKTIIEKILPVIDNFERGLANIPTDKEAKAFYDGMDMIYKQFLKTLEEIGIEKIEALGKEFNPDFHNAIMHIEDESYGENIVIEELLKGYKYKDTIIRYSMVKVAN